MLPFGRPRPVTASPSDVVLSSQLCYQEPKYTPEQLAAIRQQQAKILEIERSKILTAPFRQASYWIWKAFQAFKRVWTRENVIRVQIKGRNGTWKLDKEAAWLLDDGRALDRLVKHRLL